MSNDRRLLNYRGEGKAVHAASAAVEDVRVAAAWDAIKLGKEAWKLYLSPQKVEMVMLDVCWMR